MRPHVAIVLFGIASAITPLDTRAQNESERDLYPGALAKGLSPQRIAARSAATHGGKWISVKPRAGSRISGAADDWSHGVDWDFMGSSGTNHAQIDVAGSFNRASILQSAAGGASQGAARHVAGSTATIEQRGQFNVAKVEQSNGIAMKASVANIGHENKTSVHQTGEFQTAIAIQNGNSTVKVLQAGQANRARALEWSGHNDRQPVLGAATAFSAHAGGSVSMENRNFMHLQQEGKKLKIDARQQSDRSAVVVVQTGYGHDADIQQSGHINVGVLVQYDGALSRVELAQFGHESFGTVAQYSGYGNKARTRQSGTNNASTTIQMGGSLNKALTSQEGFFTQSGGGHIGHIMQNGNSNMARITQG